MSNEIEAFGAMTTAGLAATTLDRPSVRRRLARVAAARVGIFGAAAPPAPAAGHHAPATCANCDAVLIGDFCHACGQSAHVHRSIGHVFEEFLHGVWHFDSKAWRTLPLLVFRPGRLTYDYAHGRRARYVAPLALFLFSVFLMFFVFGFVGGPNVGGSTTDRLTAARSDVSAASKNLARARKQLSTAIAENETEDRQDAERRIAKYTKRQAAAQAELQRVEALPANERAEPVVERGWQGGLAKAAAEGKLNVATGFPEIDANIQKALKNPEFAFYRVQQKAYKLSFLLVPLSLPVLWLMFFWRRDVTIYDHTVFALYSLSFMSLLFIAIALAGKAADSLASPDLASTAALLVLVPPFHMFAQLRGAYRLSFGGALLRTFILALSSVVVLSAFVALIVVVGLAD